MSPLSKGETGPVMLSIRPFDQGFEPRLDQISRIGWTVELLSLCIQHWQCCRCSGSCRGPSVTPGIQAAASENDQDSIPSSTCILHNTYTSLWCIPKCVGLP